MSFANDFKVGIRQALGAQKANIIQPVARIGVLRISIGLLLLAGPPSLSLL